MHPAMSKYENEKTLRITKARAPRICHECGNTIEKGSKYFRESLGFLAKPPGIKLKSYCTHCRIAPAVPDEVL